MDVPELSIVNIQEALEELKSYNLDLFAYFATLKTYPSHRPHPELFPRKKKKSQRLEYFNHPRALFRWEKLSVGSSSFSNAKDAILELNNQWENIDPRTRLGYELLSEIEEYAFVQRMHLFLPKKIDGKSREKPKKVHINKILQKPLNAFNLFQNQFYGLLYRSETELDVNLMLRTAKLFAGKATSLKEIKNFDLSMKSKLIAFIWKAMPPEKKEVLQTKSTRNSELYHLLSGLTRKKHTIVDKIDVLVGETDGKEAVRVFLDGKQDKKTEPEFGSKQLRPKRPVNAFVLFTMFFTLKLLKRKQFLNTEFNHEFRTKFPKYANRVAKNFPEIDQTLLLLATLGEENPRFGFNNARNAVLSLLWSDLSSVAKLPFTLLMEHKMAVYEEQIEIYSLYFLYTRGFKPRSTSITTRWTNAKKESLLEKRDKGELLNKFLLGLKKKNQKLLEQTEKKMICNKVLMLSEKLRAWSAADRADFFKGLGLGFSEKVFGAGGIHTRPFYKIFLKNKLLAKEEQAALKLVLEVLYLG